MRLRLSLYALALLTAGAVVAAAPPSTSPVADAAMRGNRDAVRSLLQQGADVNGAQGDGMSALHWAADRGDAELTAMLVYAGANPGAVTRIGQYTPLHLASRSGNVEAVKTLLGAGAAVDARTSTTGVTPLHLAATAGSTPVVTALLDRKADVNARENEWGQTPLIFAASLNRVEAIKVLLAGGADPNVTSKTIDLQKHTPLYRASNERLSKVLEASAGKNGKPTPSQVQAAVQASRDLYTSGKLPEPEKKEGNEGNQQQFFEETPGLSTKGGLTALLHAARQGHLPGVTALLDGGADVNVVSAGDGTSPLLMATINGQFDTAMLLLERGADPNLAARVNGATPLWAAINTQWQPRTRFPQPQEMELQKATYLDVMGKLLEKGADPNARLYQHPWYMVYSGCGNRNCGLADTAGSTAFWRAAYSTDVEAMRLLVKYGADPNIPTMAPQAAGAPRPRGRRPRQRRRQQAADHPAAGAAGDPLRRAGRDGAARRCGRRVRRGLRRQRPPPRPRQLAAGGEVPGRGDGRRRQRPRQRRLHRAAPRRGARRQRSDSLPGQQGRRRHRGGAQRPDHRRHGQRPGAARLAVPGHRRPAREARKQEQSALRLVLAPGSSG